jgi:hypothetical protein
MQDQGAEQKLEQPSPWNALESATASQDGSGPPAGPAMEPESASLAADGPGPAGSGGDATDHARLTGLSDLPDELSSRDVAG